jgi:predicted DCC family thiol-disulfide oxidoreductase YuxK
MTMNRLIDEPSTVPARRVRGSLWRTWFEPALPGALGFCRLLFFGLMFVWHLDLDFTVWGTLTPAFANNRIFLWRVLDLSVPSAKTLAMIEFAWKAALLLSCIGLFTRFSTAVSFLVGLYLLSVPHQFGKTGHGDGILMLTMLILALARCGDAWSIDSLVRAYRGRQPRDRTATRSGEYTWPIRMVWLLMAMIFLAAGVTKLRWSGLGWITSDNLQNTILQHHYGSLSEPATSLGLWVAQHKYLCRAIAGATVLMEIAFPLVLFSRFARWTLVPGMFAAQVFIYLMIGVAFTQFMFAYLFFVPWERVGRAIRRAVESRGAYAMLYDGGCGMCRSIASVAARLDVLRRIEPIDALNEWPVIEKRFSALSQQTCLTDMHVVGPRGTVYTGYRAYRALAWAMPATWPLLPILYVPGVPWIGQRAYRYVADHRHDQACAALASPSGRG